MAEGEKIYVGNGKKHTFPNGGSEIKIRLCLDGLKDFHEKYGFTSDAGKHFLTLIVSEKREEDQYHNTHTVRVDTWKPDSARSGGNSSPAKNDAPDDNIDDIPF
jgi:hypothetical protein